MLVLTSATNGFVDSPAFAFAFAGSSVVLLTAIRIIAPFVASLISFVTALALCAGLGIDNAGRSPGPAVVGSTVFAVELGVG